MTNEDVIKTLESERLHLVCISEEMDRFIRDNYTKGDSEGKFYKVYRQGNDAHTMRYRGSTFDEFYGGGIVD